MGAFSFVKFWKSTGKSRRQGKLSEPISGSSSSPSSSMSRNPLDYEEEDLVEGDESFFELEISVPCAKNIRDGRTTETTPVSVSPVDRFSKNEVIPVEIGTGTKPTVGLLRSGSMFRAISFKKSKSTENSTTAEITGLSSFSFRKTASSLKLQKTDDTLSEDSLSSSSSSSSKRFFSLIRPKKQNKEKANSVNSQRLNMTRKHSSAAVYSSPPASRANESLFVQDDGIQNAILHCKKSFQSSGEYSDSSRSASDSSSQEKLSSTFSEDSYLFSQASSDYSSDENIYGC